MGQATGTSVVRVICPLWKTAWRGWAPPLMYTFFLMQADLEIGHIASVVALGVVKVRHKGCFSDEKRSSLISPAQVFDIFSANDLGVPLNS